MNFKTVLFTKVKTHGDFLFLFTKVTTQGDFLYIMQQHLLVIIDNCYRTLLQQTSHTLKPRKSLIIQFIHLL